jgi:hypothetical protein
LILGPRIKIARAFFIFTTSSEVLDFQIAEGEAHVDGAADHDRITVTQAKGEYRAIQVRVAKGPIEFARMVVHFATGTSEDIAIRDRIPAGGQTRVIDLPGARRIIESVEFWYAKANWRENRPMVRLWGRR